MCIRDRAVDINTLYNPYHKRLKNGKEVVEHATARPYLDRSKNNAYMIKKEMCIRDRRGVIMYYLKGKLPII